MASFPAAVFTVRVWYPVSVAGNCATIAVLDHEVTVSVCGVDDPAGVAYTLQLLHCEPNCPLSVIAVPDVTARPAAVDSGVTETMAAPILQRVAAK
jgi:hypothetical protein